MTPVINLDKKIFNWLHQMVGRNAILDDVWKFTSVYFVYLIPIFLVLNWFTNIKSRETSIRAAVVGVVGWQIITPIISMLWFRERPFVDGGLGTKELIFHRPTYSFPSDHSLFAFAVATGFYLAGYREIGIGLYILAFIVAFSRVVVGVHFPLDVVVGAIIGVGLSWLVWKYHVALDPYLVKPFMTVAKWLRLA